MTKLKLSASVLAVLAASVLGVTSAAATTGGHFTSSVSHTSLTGLQNTSHPLHFKKVGDAATAAVGCEHNFYKGVMSAATLESVTIIPEWEKCYTTGTPNTKFEIDENGCTFTFTIGKTGTHHTVDLLCPPAAAIEVTHPSCTVKISPQTVTGVVYKTATAGNPAKHTITLEVTVKGVGAFFESGICVFLGTNHEFEMYGSVTVEGFDTEGKRADITATTTTP